VNLERPLAANGRYGGHVVQGHVDGTGEVQHIEQLDDGSYLFTFSLPAELISYVVEKGSIAVDGISLTVAGVTPTSFSIAIIPHTHAVTAMGRRQVGDTVNLEADVLAKYVERLVRPSLQ
jgi:riboflavin synthase